MGILRPPKVQALTGLSRSTIGRMVKQGTFPAPGVPRDAQYRLARERRPELAREQANCRMGDAS